MSDQVMERPDPESILDDLIPRASYDGEGPLEMTVAELCAVNWIGGVTFITATGGPVLPGDLLFGKTVELVEEPTR